MVLARVFVVGCLLAAQNVLADFTGKVVGVSDGDTITVLKDREQVKVRMVEIDAPDMQVNTFKSR
jgi:endonuclease YncB( thermonuclease family)